MVQSFALTIQMQLLILNKYVVEFLAALSHFYFCMGTLLHLDKTGRWVLQNLLYNVLIGTC